jgi:hypothetical protein
MNKKFSELVVGERFTLNGTEYVKAQEVKVSCCRSVNCQSISDPNNKTYVQPSTTVTING